MVIKVLLLIVILVFGFPFLVHAGLYKCEVDGKIVYTDKQCTTSETKEIEVDTGNTGFDFNANRPAGEEELLLEYREKNRRIKEAQGKSASKSKEKRVEKKRIKRKCKSIKEKVEYYDQRIRRRSYTSTAQRRAYEREISRYNRASARLGCR